MSKALLEIQNLHVRVEEKKILHGVDLTVGQDETHVLMGPNGTGKSTLGYAITGNPTYSVTGGSIIFNGEDITELPVNERAKKGIFLSFHKFTTISKTTFVGLDNYFKVFQDSTFVSAFWFTAKFTVVSTLLINVIAFAIALALTRGLKGTNIFRTVFFMPNLIGGIVLGYIWKLIFDAFLRSASLQPLLTNATYGFWGLVILVAWQQIGYMMIIYIAGLQAIPDDMLEAAKIDGASRWQTLWKITIPNVMPSITICTFLSLTNGFKLFDQNLALTGGQPYTILSDGSSIKETEMLALNILNTFYGQNANSRGTAQAKAVLFFILVATIGLLQLSANRKKEVQQ